MTRLAGILEIFIIQFPAEKQELQFDPQNLPKYCPQCRSNGIKSRVKIYTLNDEKLVMCKNGEVSIFGLFNIHFD